MTETTTEVERADLRASIRALLTAKSTGEQVLRAVEQPHGHDELLWKRMSEDLGLQSLSLPEAHGGDGFGQLELSVVLGELGRAVLPGPFFSSVVLAGSALVASGDEAAQAAHLPGIASGEVIATLAVIEHDGGWRTDGFLTSAVSTPGGWLLRGEKALVPDGDIADLLLVAADTESGPTLFAIDARDPGLTRTPLRTLDLTRRTAQVRFRDVAAVPVGPLGGATEILDQVLDRASIALAAEQVGAARACLEMSTAYARERMQFGRAIGSFQAIKHKCADMFARIELAEAAVVEAVRAADGADDAPPLGVAAAVAHSVCSDAFMFVATENIQVHGGIGFTWDHPAHLYFRRAKATQMMFGGPGVYFERLLAQLGV
ncbi:acyl-CoA dehydrogenase family protein [Tomitella biformata]|uniref:acyl-CoA dehydrogenase family protein n=1 Tax=Tomitella biformata TaxID=630403 RepID=UPI000463EF57|nr:acyl-CoA dehydrogenase family protein [Tomitella biformata]